MRVMIASAAAATVIGIEIVATGTAAIVTVIAMYGATARGIRAAIARAARIAVTPLRAALKAVDNPIAIPGLDRR